MLDDKYYLDRQRKDEFKHGRKYLNRFRMHEFGKYMRRCRQEIGLSLKTIASIVGCSSVYLWGVEVGKSPPMQLKWWPNLIKAIPNLNRGTIEKLYIEYYLKK